MAKRVVKMWNRGGRVLERSTGISRGHVVVGIPAESAGMGGCGGRGDNEDYDGKLCLLNN